MGRQSQCELYPSTGGYAYCAIFGTNRFAACTLAVLSIAATNLDNTRNRLQNALHWLSSTCPSFGNALNLASCG